VRAAVFNNFWLKLFALGLAALVWVTVSAERREQKIERTYDVPLALVAVPPELVVTKGLQPTVNVRVRGPLSTIRALSSQNLEATVDLRDIRPGDNNVFIRAQELNIPGGIELVSITPPKVTLTVEPRRQKYVPVRPFLVGDPPAGKFVLDVTAEPPQVIVSGPVSAVRDFTELATDRIILSGRNEDFTITVGVVSDSSLVRVIDPQSVRVTVTLQSSATEATDAAASTETTQSGRIPATEATTPK
jgi:YbbR domain-containing protein